MNVSVATDEHLKVIINNDKDCPNDLLLIVVEEMMNRNLWDDIILYTAKLMFKNLDFALKQRLKMEREDLIQIGSMVIFKCIEKFRQGMRTFKTFVIMNLKSEFIHMIRDVHAVKRKSNIGTFDVNKIPEQMQDRYFISPFNVEKYVINKIMIEESFTKLRQIEIKAIEMEQQGYSQYEISREFGFNPTQAHTLLKRAYKKLQKQMVG